MAHFEFPKQHVYKTFRKSAGIFNNLKIKRLILLILFVPAFLHGQVPAPPAVQNNFTKVTSYEEISSYVSLLDKYSGLIKAGVIGQSVQGRNLYGLMFSSSKFGKDESKIKVLIFAQQHGNEQSGKEGALLLAQELLKPENRYLFDKIDLLLVPQVNPDGSEVNERRNTNEADLNRNHLILTEPETRALHGIFDNYLFEVTLDVHEYYPYGDEWKAYGYRKNSDENIGTATNLDVSAEIRALSAKDYLPFFFKYLSDRHFTSFEYCPGGPPEINYIRHSTFDINDGRQSFAIQNSFSFIQEGKNGTDDLIENLQHRAEGQMTGMRALLEFAYLNKDKIKSLVEGEREKLANGSANTEVAVQSIHTGNGQKLEIPLFSYYSGKDSVVFVNDYRPVVKSLYDVKKPVGYLIPKQMTELKEWADRQSLEISSFKNSFNYLFEQYFINNIESIDFEGDTVVNPQVEVRRSECPACEGGYYFIPTAQLKGNMVVLALEPKSMLGLATYEKYAHLLKAGELYPVIRVINKE
jgi:hypothetical protein